MAEDMTICRRHSDRFFNLSLPGLIGDQRIKAAPGYQLPFAKAVSSLKLPSPLTATVGRLESGEHAGQLAEQALHDADASLIFVARGFLTNPSWVEAAAENLVGTVTTPNPQYHRGEFCASGDVKRIQR